MEEVQGVKWCVGQGAGFIFEAMGEDLMMCGVRLVDRVLTDILRDRVGVVVKIEDMIIQSCLWWYGHVMCGDINSQTCEVMEVEITGKRIKG